MPGDAIFEPWSLGDVLVALGVLREAPGSAVVASHSKWHPLLQAVLSDRPGFDFQITDLPYTTRHRRHPFDLGKNVGAGSQMGGRVLSIRGDLRDYYAAVRIFPRASICMTGWPRFFARKIALADIPFQRGWLAIENRYVSWARLLGVPFERVSATYSGAAERAPRSGLVVLHIGAQWRSRQYPHVASLAAALQQQGFATKFVAHASDPEPAGVRPEEVVRPTNQELVALLRSAEHVIANDSGPMHLAAFLGCRTTVLARVAQIAEWQPPGVRVIENGNLPRGYRPHPKYMSDEILDGWPTVQRVVETLVGTAPRRLDDSCIASNS